ncbi:hypothetical protein RJ641_019263 [Dillenia turbinata]|uniref:Stress enhanced protein 1, chloroplastic n=1 Tax=Dillenia turbinata TaxID=194707 RepID=A0AAN8UTE3_9MAGN
MAFSQVSASLYFSICDVTAAKTVGKLSAPQLPRSNFARAATSFVRGSPILIKRTSHRRPLYKATSGSIRCEQRTKEGNNLDVWLGRLAMVGFVAAISVEIATGKGLLENFGLTTPLPTVALAVTALVGVLTAIFIFQSASKN